MPSRLPGLLTALAGALALGVAACGGDDEPAASTDLAFVSDMTPHHESAVEMAEIARERSTRPEIRRLAADIIRTQSTEIREFATIEQRLEREGAEAAGLGVSHSQMGMDMEPGELRTAKPFDRAFIDMMVPHHQGAIRMARVELAEGEDARVKAIARAVIEAQSREIEQMNQWRERWFGAPSPAGGVPAEDDELVPDGGHGSGHSG